MKNILLVAITRMGDMLQASPTVTGLREEHPDARIVVAIDKQFAAICTGIPGIDEVYCLDLTMVVKCIHRGGDGIVEGYKYVDKMISDLRKRDFDYVLNMSSSPYTALMLKMLDAPESRGWMADEEGYRVITDPWAMLFAAFVYHSNRDYNSLNLVDIFRCAAGVKKHPLKLVYEPTVDDRYFATRFFEDCGITGKGPIIGIQAGASQGKRQWPTRQFAKLAAILVQTLDARVVFTGSPSEQPIIDEILGHYSHSNVVSALGKTTFGQLSGLLESIDLLITGDTGPMHLAVAVGTPVVALFIASALCFETGPYSPGNFVLEPQIDCHPCNPNFPCARPDCHDQITPEMVAFLARTRLSTPFGEEHTVAIPAEVLRRRDVAIYYTGFDSDGFLEFRSLGGEADRNGHTAEFLKTSRATYRALWKEEFAECPYAPLAPDPTAQALSSAHNSLPHYDGLYEIVSLANHGESLLARLIDLARDQRSAAQGLKDVNMSIHGVDVKIEEIGLTYPVLGALVRIFLMEKENLRGDDVCQLASDTSKLYSNLIRRAKRFAQLFRHFTRPEPALTILREQRWAAEGGIQS